MTKLFELRPRQVEALDHLKDAIRTGARRPVLQAPTGFGKTVLAAHIVDGALRKGKRVAFCVPRISLIDQTFDRFRANGIPFEDMGVIQASHPLRRYGAPLQICSVQTIAARVKHERPFPEIDVCVIDEAHERYKIVDQWIDAKPGVLFVGLTATPWSKGLGDVYDRLVAPVSLKTLIDEGQLSRFRIFASSHPDLSHVKITAGDYNEKGLAKVMGQKEIIADVVSNWIEKGERRQTILFAVDRAHAAELCEQFLEAGVAAEYVDGNTTREDREAMLKRFSNGDTLVICSVGTMTTGIDVPCQCIILARPTKSEILFVQMIGRGLRTEPGKDDCRIFDHTNTTLNLGLPTDIGCDTLRTAQSDADEKAAKDRQDAPETLPKPRECRECHFLIPPGHCGPCPSCGAVPKRQNDVVVHEGELYELGTKAPTPAQAAAKKSSAISRLQAQGQSAIFCQLKAMQGKRADGWVSHKFKEIFGYWPSKDMIHHSVEPSYDLSLWVRSQNIRYAKSMHNRKSA